MRPKRGQPNVPRKSAVKKLAQKCRCGKLGYLTESGAMDAVISGRYAFAGVRVYQCGSGLWHTTSKAKVMEERERDEEFVPTTGPVGELNEVERTLVHAVRFVRRLRADGRGGEQLVGANNAAQAALAAATKLSRR